MGGGLALGSGVTTKLKGRKVVKNPSNLVLVMKAAVAVFCLDLALNWIGIAVDGTGWNFIPQFLPLGRYDFTDYALIGISYLVLLYGQIPRSRLQCKPFRLDCLVTK
jgi:hypothetical protein